MASRSLDDLDPEVKAMAERVQNICDEAEVDILIYCTLRPLEEQAQLYRQSRSRATITRKIDEFHNRGFGFLAEILESAGPQSGSHVTNAAPGESFHNYGLAFDAVPMSGGKCCWSHTSNEALWAGYGEAVRQVGMEWAGDWTSFREYPHAQLGAGGNPLRIYGADRVKELLEKNGLLMTT